MSDSKETALDNEQELRRRINIAAGSGGDENSFSSANASADKKASPSHEKPPAPAPVVDDNQDCDSIDSDPEHVRKNFIDFSR